MKNHKLHDTRICQGPDFRAKPDCTDIICNFWHPGTLTLRVERRVPGCRKLQMTAEPGLAQDTLQDVTTVGVKGLTRRYCHASLRDVIEMNASFRHTPALQLPFYNSFIAQSHEVCFEERDVTAWRMEIRPATKMMNSVDRLHVNPGG